MHQKILAFADFLARPPRSYNEIAKFLVMNTFSEEKSLAIYIGELIETGVVCNLGGFGWRATEVESFLDLPIQSLFPHTEAIREREIIVVQNNAAFKLKYPLMSQFKLTQEWKSGIAIPIYPIGSMFLYSANKISTSEATHNFYIAIGSLLGLYASKPPIEQVDVARQVRKTIDLPEIPMTDRQLVIAGLLERGFNNAQIGLEIGYSESLIRQETVAIYKKLQVTGRQAMQAIRALNLEAEAEATESLLKKTS